MLNASRRRLLGGLAAASLVIGAPALVRPRRGGKPLVIFLTASAGTSLDTLARMLGDKLRVALGRPVVAEAKPGAGGMLAIRSLRALEDDGSFLLMAPSSDVALLPLFTGRPGFDAEQDLQPVVECASAPMALTVHAAGGLRSMAGYFDAVRLMPKLGSVGVPSPVSLAALVVEELARELRLPLQPVAYRGGGPLLLDLLGQQIPASGAILPDSLAYHRAGKLRILGQASATRSPLAPGIPTFTEAGYPGHVAVTSLGLFAKAGIPGSVAADYAAIVTAALAERPMVAVLHQMGLTPVGGTPAEFRHKVQSDRERWGPAMRESGLSMGA